MRSWLGSTEQPKDSVQRLKMAGTGIPIYPHVAVNRATKTIGTPYEAAGPYLCASRIRAKSATADIVLFPKTTKGVPLTRAAVADAQSTEVSLSH